MLIKCDLYRIKGLRSNSLQLQNMVDPSRKERKHNLHSVPCNLVHDRCYFPLWLIMLVVMNSIAPFWSSSSLLHVSFLFFFFFFFSFFSAYLLLLLLLFFFVCLFSSSPFHFVFSFSSCVFSSYLILTLCFSHVLLLLHHLSVLFTIVLLHYYSFLVFLFLLISVVLSFPLLSSSFWHIHKQSQT